ncbi:MAG: hypothetical protein HY556_05915 [Euryarchaeota archaeon]|nr:hypothetical protein [Euryarchaeota archaeon]
MINSVYLTAEAEGALPDLSPRQRRKVRWWINRLAGDSQAGDHVRRVLIPPALRKRYGISNLWRGEIPGGWRLLYTIPTEAGRQNVVTILFIIDHKKYDRLFGYSTS